MDTPRRQAIPAPLRRAVLVEAGHRCAIHTCRGVPIEIHHIVPWIKVKAHAFDNLIALCANCHSRHHRGDIDRLALIEYKQRLSDQPIVVTASDERDFLISLAERLTTYLVTLMKRKSITGWLFGGVVEAEAQEEVMHMSTAAKRLHDEALRSDVRALLAQGEDLPFRVDWERDARADTFLALFKSVQDKLAERARGEA